MVGSSLVEGTRGGGITRGFDGDPPTSIAWAVGTSHEGRGRPAGAISSVDRVDPVGVGLIDMMGVRRTTYYARRRGWMRVRRDGAKG